MQVATLIVLLLHHIHLWHRCGWLQILLAVVDWLGCGVFVDLSVLGILLGVLLLGVLLLGDVGWVFLKVFGWCLGVRIILSVGFGA
jgi:hypothetical protein